MENKIVALCSLLTEYYKERKGFSFEVIKGEPALVVERVRRMVEGGINEDKKDKKF